MNTRPTHVIVQPGEGRDLQAFGNILSVMLNGKQTNGILTVMLESTPPGSGPPLHVHSREEEIFLVVEGQVSYFVDGIWTEVKPGGLVYLPRGVEHCYRNTGSVPSRHWIITTPSGFEDFFANCSDEFARDGGPDGNRIVALHREHGIELLENGG